MIGGQGSPARPGRPRPPAHVGPPPARPRVPPGAPLGSLPRRPRADAAPPPARRVAPRVAGLFPAPTPRRDPTVADQRRASRPATRRPPTANHPAHGGADLHRRRQTCAALAVDMTTPRAVA